MNILVTLDSNYVNQLNSMLTSLVWANYNECFDVYIIHSSLTPYDLKRIDSVSRKIKIHPITVDNSFFKNAHFTKRITKETYYRLLLCEYLPADLDKILYLDPDIIILNSIYDLYNLNFGDKCFAAAPHTRGIVEWFNKKRLKMSKSSQYINAGVLMINLENLRKIINTEEIFAYTNKMGKKLFQADQDVLNAMFYKDTIYLPAEIYNLDERIYRIKKLNLECVAEKTVIVHYDGKNKPWNDNYKGKLNVFYNKFKTKNIVALPNRSTENKTIISA